MRNNQEYVKGRQLNIEGYLQGNRMEGEENVEVPSIRDVLSQEEIGTKAVSNKLLEEILSKDNMNEAYKRVKANKGSRRN